MDIKDEGRRSDGGIFRSSELGQKLKKKILNLANPSFIYPNRPSLPYVFNQTKEGVVQVSCWLIFYTPIKESIPTVISIVKAT